MKRATLKEVGAKRVLGYCLLICLVLATAAGQALADGWEILGPPSIAIAPGTGLAFGATGLIVQPGAINVAVPGGATVEQVLLYWYGRGGTGDDTIMIDATEVTGTLIGETLGLPFPPSQAYRADITGLGLISAGNNSLSASGLTFTFHNDGAGVVVVFDDGIDAPDIQIRDGHDFAAFNQGFVDPLDRMVPQTFSFAASISDRTAMLTLFVADGEASRPDAVEITVGAVTDTFHNVVVASDGGEWDTLSFDVDIPAGETSVTVEVISYDDATSKRPDSIAWIVAALEVPAPDEILECRVTGGGTDKYGQWNGRWAKAVCENGDGINRYTFGGEAGAPTASQPQPWGNWTHSQHSGPDGSFTFHAGTRSAPPGTEIDFVQCSDPGWCVQARPAPAKQIDFEGIGTFKNINRRKAPPVTYDNVIVGETHHWFEVHIEDLGEPGKGGKVAPPTETCPPEGSAGELADCGCPDFYHIIIYEAFDPQSDPVNMTDVIYEALGYINGGNLQIHPTIK
jgi:hypothetical protein